MNLLDAVLPEWFTSWGWIVLVVAVVVLIAMIVLIVLTHRKNKRAVAKPEDSGEEVCEPVYEQESTAEPEEEEPTEEEKREVVREEEEDVPAEEKTEPAAQPKRTAQKTYHIGKRKADGKWQVKIAGGSKAIKLFNTQLEAINFAKKLAENQEAKIVIHKEDGTFRRLTYHNTKK